MDNPNVPISSGDNWQEANAFRQHVCYHLNLCEAEIRKKLAGEYLFIIDKNPKFTVKINEDSAESVFFETSEEGHTYAEKVAHTRVKVLTSKSTLDKLLGGHLKARLAFLTGRVKINGDFLAFLKLVSILKKEGIKQNLKSKY